MKLSPNLSVVHTIGCKNGQLVECHDKETGKEFREGNSGLKDEMVYNMAW